MVDIEVRPCVKVPAQSVRLSIPDAVAPKRWPILLLFWPLEDTGNFEQSHHNLREGLSRLLAEVPVLLGNITRDANADSRDLGISLREDASVAFSVEDVSTMEAIPSYQDLLRCGFPTTGLKVPLSPKVSLGPMLEGSPMFCAKMNQIKGGAVLAFGFAHVLADGTTVSELGRIWAQHSLDVSHSIAFRKHKTVTPDQEIRDRLSTKPILETGAVLDPFLQIVPSEEARMHLHRDAASAESAKQKAAARMLGNLKTTGERPESQSIVLWSFTPHKLMELKQAASSSDADWISTMDALAGLFWSRISHIQGQSAKGHHMSMCLFMLSFRPRLQPPIPEAYVGNAFSPVAAECSLRKLESEDAGLKAAAQSMRRANKGWNQSRWDAWLEKIITLPIEQAVTINREVSSGKHNLRFNNYSRYSFNTSDWGAPLGQVGRTRTMHSMFDGGAIGVWVLPRLPDGALEVSLICSDALRDSLLEDPVFTRYADFVCHHQ